MNDSDSEPQPSETRPVGPIDPGTGDGIQLCASHEVDSRPKPHGLLPLPPEVETIVLKEEARLLKEKGIVLTSEARRRLVDSLSLQYYFEGIDVAYRTTTPGVEILAIGLSEVAELVRGMNQEELSIIKIGQP